MDNEHLISYHRSDRFTRGIQLLFWLLVATILFCASARQSDDTCPMCRSTAHQAHLVE